MAVVQGRRVAVPVRHGRVHRARRLPGVVVVVRRPAPPAVRLVVAGPAGAVDRAVADAVPALQPGLRREGVALHPQAPAVEGPAVEEGRVVGLMPRPLEVVVRLRHRVRRRRRRRPEAPVAAAAAGARQVVQRPPDQRHPLPRRPVVLRAQHVPGVQRHDLLEPLDEHHGGTEIVSPTCSIAKSGVDKSGDTYPRT